MKTSRNIKLLLQSFLTIAHNLNDEQVEELLQVTTKVATEVAEATHEARINNTEYKVTSDPDEMIERIRIKLFGKKLLNEFMELMKPR